MSIVWKKKVEAGILLYALLMVAVFSLVLAFYLNRQVATQRNLVLEREKVAAYTLATLSQKEGVTSNIGTSQVKPDGNLTKVEVSLKTGRSYQFDFPKAKEEEKKVAKKETEAEKELKASEQQRSEAGKLMKEQTSLQGSESQKQSDTRDSQARDQEAGNSAPQP